MLVHPEKIPRLIGGRLALDFVNAVPTSNELSWSHLIAFLESAGIATPERGGELMALSRSDPQAAQALLRKAQGFAAALRLALDAILHKQKVQREWIDPVNEILRI